MKNKVLGRALSGLLTLCMILGMFPAIELPAFAEDVAGQAFEIDFAACKTAGHDSALTHATLSDHNWQYIETESKAFERAFSISDLGLYGYCALITDGATDKYRWATVSFNVPEDGFYDVNVIAAQNARTGTVETSIDGQALKSFNPIVEGGSTRDFALDDGNAIGCTFLSAGPHKIKFMLTNERYMYINKVVFTPMNVDATKVGLTTPQIDALQVGESTETVLELTYDGTPFFGATVDSVVAACDVDGVAEIVVSDIEGTTSKKLSIKALKEGYVNIKISANVNGAPVTSTVPLIILDGPAHVHTIDFTKCAANGHDTDASHATLETCGWEINEQASDEKNSRDNPHKSITATSTGLIALAANPISSTDTYSVVVDFYIPEGGYYEMQYVGSGGAGRSWTRIVVDGQAYLGEFGNTTWTPGKMYLSEGRHSLWLQATTGLGFAPAKLVFTEQIMLPGDATVSVGKLKAVNLGMTEAVSLSAAQADGTAIKSAQTDIRATTRDDSIATATVTRDLATGEAMVNVTGVGEGETVIDLDLYMCNRYVASCTLPVSVRNAAFNKMTLAIASPSIQLLSDGTQLSIAAYDKDGLFVSTKDAVINYLSADENVVTVDSTGHVTPVNPGKTTLTATVTIGGVTKSASVDIVVLDGEAKVYTIDFTACNQNGHSEDMTHATIEECGWEFNEEVSEEKNVKENPHKSLKVTPDGIVALANHTIDSTDTYSIAIDFELPEGGYYKFDYVGAAGAGRSWTRIVIDGRAYTGDFGNVTWSPGNVFLSKGKHTLWLQATTGLGFAAKKLVFTENIVLPGEAKLNVGRVENVNKNMTELATLTVVPNTGTTVQSGQTDIRAVARDEGILETEIKIDPETGDSGLYITGVGVGETIIDISLYMCNRFVTSVAMPINVRESVFDRFELDIPSRLIGLNSGGGQLSIIAYDPDGLLIDMAGAQVEYESSDEGVATVSETGFITPVSTGTTNITATMTIGDTTKTAAIEIIVKDKKVASTIRTPEMIEAARENVKTYAWAMSSAASTISQADKYVGKEDFLWKSITTQELPRSIDVGWRYDPENWNCRYCGIDLRAEYGLYSWLFDAMNDPFKIQCPKCRRRFPSNDFASFYELGIGEDGMWHYELAKQKNAELVAAGEEGYLVNNLYPEKGEGWGVDDGYGYRTGEQFVNGNNTGEITHAYIPYYNHWAVWHSPNGIAHKAMTVTSMAYLYTGEKQYGRVAAIMADRIADVYPTLFTIDYYPFFFTWQKGKEVDLVWSCAGSKSFVHGYDYSYDMYDDPYVVDFLSKKAAQYNMANPKNTPELIRQNCEDGILREVYKACKDGHIRGNFGMHQSSVVAAGVALDTMPESIEMINFAMQNGYDQAGFAVTGGNFIAKMITDVSRDGFGNEAAPGYNNLWIGNMRLVADYLANYPGYEEANFYKNPKFIKMMKAGFPMILSRYYTPDIADSGLTASKNIQMTLDNIVTAFKYTGDPEFAQMAYFLNGNKVTGINTGIWSKNPEAIQAEILDVINKYGEWDGFDKSAQLAGYGWTALKGGTYKKATDIAQTVNTQRNFWMYYGIGVNYGGKHGHGDGLTIGMDAYGLNMMPDLGYPEACDSGDKYTYDARSTISHNTVQVNATRQTGIQYNGDPLHYDGDGRVKLMDVSAPEAYKGITSIYRRSLVMVDVDDTISYGVDFFRVKGGNEHVYSFHALSDTINETVGLDLVKQADANGEYIGSYAGPNVPYAAAASISGYSWIKNVRRDEEVEANTFAVDFEIIDDFRKILPFEQDLHLRLTMLPSTELSDVAIGTYIPPQRDDNPKSLEYVLARRSGTNLDTMFTSLIEPYKDERYIVSQELVPVVRKDENPIGNDEIVRAVKVTLANGRVDYVVYATDNTVEYRVDDTFDFAGFVGVYTIADGDCIYSYLNDGTKIGDVQADNEVTGIVDSFTKELARENQITVMFNEDVDFDSLAGHWIYVENDGVENAAYPINKLTDNGDGTVTIDIGDLTLIRKTRNVVGMDATYSYNIAEGQPFRIPLAVETDNSPVFDSSLTNMRVEVGSELKFNVVATSPLGRELTYKAITLPRGAQFNPETQEFFWIPDSGRLGENVMAFEVSDGILSTTIYRNITVLNATGGTSSAVSNPSMGTGGGGTGGATGGDTEKPDTGKDDENDPSQGGDATGKKFVDLGAHSWAEDAIYRLVEKNVINGTSENTYSPGANITRADFTTLIVRAFNFEANTAENFSDVESGKYYSDTIAIAKALGIVNGGSDGKFNPTSSISRQDMMVIIARAAEVAGIELAGDITNDFSDKDEVAAYAVDAVGQLISSGIIAGSNGKINPNGTATRAEVAVILDRMLALNS